MKQINFKSKSGKILYNDFSIQNKPLNNQIFSLKEDLLQVEYPNGCLVDVGWYPEFDIKGYFKIMIIKDFDWDNPRKSVQCKNLSSLFKGLQLIIDKIDTLPSHKERNPL